MMKPRATQKAETRERILSSAARRIKQHGIQGASVAEVMSAIGLTVGGFYAHFASKDDLVDQSLRRAMAQGRKRFFDQVDVEEWRGRLSLMVTRYLTRKHRDDATDGCPLPSVMAEAGRLGVGQAALRDEIAALVKTLIGNQGKGDALARQSALAVIALTAGGLSLARALRKTSLSDEVLDACRAFAGQTLTAQKAGYRKRDFS